MLQLAFRLQFLNLAQHVGDLAIHITQVEIVGIPGPVLAEMVGTAIGPVKLVEIDVIGLEPHQAGFKRLAQNRTGDAGAAANVLVAFPRHLGSDHQSVAVGPALQPGSENLLRQASRFGAARRGGVHLRRVEKVDALPDCIVQLLVGFGLAVLRTPGHGAKAQFGNKRVCGSKRVVSHVKSPAGLELEKRRERLF